VAEIAVRQPNLFGPHFNGPEYQTVADHERLTRQIDRVRGCMADGRWRTLEDIAGITGDPVASISAQLRHLRKPRFGAHAVERRARGNRDCGLFEYRLILRDEQ
jgi:hypothetical protein